jgi:hypothetical protein
VAEASVPGTALRISPLQMALATAAISNEGQRPAPRLPMAVNTPLQGWVILPGLGKPQTALSSESVNRVAETYSLRGTPFWQYAASAGSTTEPFVWSLGGTQPGWQGMPVVVVVLLEEDYPLLAKYIGQKLLESAISP